MASRTRPLNTSNKPRNHPELLNARLYLATAYASLYIPGAPSQENLARGNQAVAEFKEVLDKDPIIFAIDGIGSILFQMGGQPLIQEIRRVQDLSPKAYSVEA